MSDFMRPFRFPRTDGDVLAIEDVAPAPFLVQHDPGAIESVAFPVRAGETLEPEAPGWAASKKEDSTTPHASSSTADASSRPDEVDPAVAPDGTEPVLSSGAEPADPEAAVRSTLTAELEEAKEEFAKAAVDLATARRDLLAGVQEDLIDLAVEIGRALVEDAIERDVGVHRTLARSALAQLGNVDSARLRASTAAHDALEAALGDDRSLSGISVELVRDETLGGDGYLVEVDGGYIDGRVATRLEAVRQALREALIVHRGDAEERTGGL